MKTLFLSHSNNNPNAGASSIFHMLIEGLGGRGHDIDCLHLEDMNIPQQKLARRVVDRLYLPQLISRRAMQEDLSVYDVVMAANGMAWPLFRHLKQRAKRPLLVSHYHGLTIYDQLANLSEAGLGHHEISSFYRFVSGPNYHRWDMAGLANADLGIVLNRRDLAYIETKAPPGITLAAIKPAIAPRLLEQSKVISPIGARAPQNIISFSSWGARKGSYYLPGTLRKIREKYPAARLFAGGTGMGAEEFKSHFGPQDRDAITVLGFLSREEQAQLYNDSSIFLFPSVSEGFGLALPEAQAFGLAAVTTNTGYAGDFLTDGVDAIVVPLTTEHLAEGVLKLLQNDEVRYRIAANGREVARTLTLDAMAGGYEKAFFDAISKRQLR